MNILGVDYSKAKRWLKHYNLAMPEVSKVEHETPDIFTQLSILSSPDEQNYITDLDDLTMPRKPTNCKYLLNHFNDQEAYPYFTYAYNRGLTLNDIKRYHVCYVIDGQYLKNNGKAGELFQSLVFFAKYHGKYCYWNTRAINNYQIPKSLNAPAQDSQFSRKDVVFNLNNLRKGQNICLCEGIFNSNTLDHSSSNICGVCTYGKNVTQKQVSLLSSKKGTFNKLYICLDSDAFRDSFSVFDALVNAGIQRNKIYIVDDRCLGAADWNDVGSKASLKLIHEKSFQPDILTKLKEMM